MRIGLSKTLASSASCLFLLAACGATTVPPGPAASDPACAPIVIGAPSTMLGQPRGHTTSQGTVVWGSGDDAVVLRCGVVPPGPTTEQCSRLDDNAGAVVDWIVREDDGYVLYTTYGREPAIDISVPRALAPDQPSAAPLEVGALVSQIPATTFCV